MCAETEWACHVDDTLTVGGTATDSVLVVTLRTTSMTRFDAATPTDRRKLFADAVTAHRERGSPFLTAEVDSTEETVEFGSEDDEDEDGTAESDDEDAERAPPWVQFGEREFNLDCTDDELDRLNTLLDDYPEFRIDQMEQPEEAEATNVRITARSDANRLAEFAERAFREVYEQPEEYQVWVTAV